MLHHQEGETRGRKKEKKNALVGVLSRRLNGEAFISTSGGRRRLPGEMVNSGRLTEALSPRCL